VWTERRGITVGPQYPSDYNQEYSQDFDFHRHHLFRYCYAQMEQADMTELLARVLSPSLIHDLYQFFHTVGGALKC